MLNSLIFLSVVNGLIYGLYSTTQPISAFRTLVKTASIASLAAYAFFAGGPALLIAALALSALGDFFLSRDGDRMFLAGMAAFFAAHLAYIPLFLSLAQGSDLIAERWPFVALIVLLTTGFIRLLWPGLGNLRIPVVAYSLVIAVMGLAALGLPIMGGTGLILLGAMSFVLSDTVLAIEKFYLPKNARLLRITPYVVWVFYWLAQALIAYGTLHLTA